MVTFIKCLNCENEFKQRGVKKFCSIKCRTRFNSKFTYQRLKNSETYKEERKNNLKKWVLDNREHFNDLCRDKSRIGMKKLYYKGRNENRCYVCGIRLTEKHKACEKCRLKRRLRRKKNQKEVQNDKSNTMENSFD